MARTPEIFDARAHLNEAEDLSAAIGRARAAENILLEMDCPVSHGAVASDLRDVAAAPCELAQIENLQTDVVARQTTKNALPIFLPAETGPS